MDEVIKYLTIQLNTYLNNRFGIHESFVTAGRLINQDGTVPTINENKLILSLVNLSKESSIRSYETRVGFASGGAVATASPLLLNLKVLVASGFLDELEGLKFLTCAIEFFHEHALFEKSSNPDMPDKLTNISIESLNLSLQETDALWNGIGAKLVPAALYSVRTSMLTNDA